MVNYKSMPSCRRNQTVVLIAAVSASRPSRMIDTGTITPETLVFCTIEGGLLSPDNLSREWGRVGGAKKLPRVSFHGLRHTHASMLIAAGVDILTISRRLGHSKPSVTLDTYGHLIKGADAAAAEAIARLLR